jgi:hypothetical protein
MNRSNKVIEILEGFKLGKLGAGTLKLVGGSQPETPSQVTHIKWLDENVVKRDDWALGVTWKEPDFKFYFDVTEVNSGTYEGLLVGGHELRVKFSVGDLPEFEDEEFRGAKRQISSSLSMAKDTCQSVMQIIKREGSLAAALVSGKLGKDWTFSGRVFEGYVKDRTGVNKSPNFWVGS